MLVKSIIRCSVMDPEPTKKKPRFPNNKYSIRVLSANNMTLGVKNKTALKERLLRNVLRGQRHIILTR